MIKRFIFSSLLLLLAQLLSAQNLQIKGTVKDADNDKSIQDASVVVASTGNFTASSASGDYALSGLKPGVYTIVVTHPGYFPFEKKVDGKKGGTLTVNIALRRDPAAPNNTDIPTVTLEEADEETESSSEVANLLNANRDVFQNIAGFNWSSFRFRERGYDGEFSTVLLNGIAINDPETGNAFASEFGGLNDVLRNRESSVGLNPTDFAFTDVGGATRIDTRASQQRKQIRASYASSNRAYFHRVMVTASTGLMPGGWAVSASASRRWAQEGYIPGTFYDAYSYFLSVDKKFGDNHGLNFTFLGAPNRRGRAADSFQEMYDIAGTNYYNPLWGYQNGEKRNSQVAHSHQPIGILRYDWKPGTSTNLTASAYYQAGVLGLTRFNWLNGLNPAPDFNRRLPSSLLDTTQIDDWTNQLAADENLRQVDWGLLYNTNRNNPQTILNADGTAGNTVSGNRSTYIVEDQRSDSREAGMNAVINHNLSDRVDVTAGAQFTWYEGQNFKVMSDLLGGNYWLDADFFSQFDTDANTLAGQSDVRIPNNVILEGEKFGYNYNENIRRSHAWAQMQWNLPRFQYFVSGQIGNTQYWRTGFMQNGRFPDNSLGDSKHLNFITWAAKAGAVWKMNGRNYLYANGYVGTRAPQFRDAFLSPRTRDYQTPDLVLSQVQSVEGGYILRAPNYRARITGYFTRFLNETENIFASAQSVSRVMQNVDLGGLNLGDDDTFLQVPIFFGAAVMQDIDRQHAGVEAAIEAKPIVGWTITAAANIGQYIYTSRPSLLLSLDNGVAPILNVGPVYQKEFYVPRTPQTTGTVSVRYESRRFWNLSLSLNYAANNWYEFDRVRRTANFTQGLNNQAPVWNTIIDQQKAPAAYTVDTYFWKSWRIKQDYFISFNVGINNLLNNQDIIISGRDSYRNAFRNDVSDPRFYTSELIYAFGINYFAGLTFRM